MRRVRSVRLQLRGVGGWERLGQLQLGGPARQQSEEGELGELRRASCAGASRVRCAERGAQSEQSELRERSRVGGGAEANLM